MFVWRRRQAWSSLRCWKLGGARILAAEMRRQRRFSMRVDQDLANKRGQPVQVPAGLNGEWRDGYAAELIVSLRAFFSSFLGSVIVSTPSPKEDAALSESTVSGNRTALKNDPSLRSRRR